MSKHDNLTSLIKTLSSAERRYFKLFSSLQGGEKKYVQIFDLIDKEGAYDATAIASKLNIPTSQLAVHKHYLNTVLLSSLRINNEQCTEADKVYINLLDIRLLLNRRLFTQAIELIEKNIEQAWHGELFELLHELLRLKQECLIGLQRHKDAIKLHDEKVKLMAISQEYNEILQLNNIISWEDKKRDDKAAVKKLMEHKLMKTPPEKLLSLRAAIQWFDTLWDSYLLIGKYDDDLLKLARNEKVFFDKHPKLKRIQGMQCVICYTRLSKAEAHTGNISKALSLLDKLEQLLDDGDFNIPRVKSVSVKCYIYISRAILYQNQGRFEDMLQEVEKARPLKASRSVYEQLSINFSEAVALVNLKQSRKAVAKIDELILTKLEVKPIFEKSLRPLLILAQIDMGNYELLPYLIKSAKAWMKRNKYNEEQYDLFYTYATEISNAQSEKERKDVYRRMLQVVKADTIHTLADDCSLNYWLRKKIEAKA